MILSLSLLGAQPSSAANGAPPPRRLIVGSTGLPLIGVLDVERDGRLSSVPGSPFATGLASLGVAITPDARTVYSTHTGSGTIIGYRMGSDGSLTRIDGATVVAGGPAVGVAVSPDGKRLFTTVGMSPVEVRSYDISSSGALTPTGAPPARIDGATFSQVSITPDGRHLVFTDWSANTVRSFAIADDAGLTPVGEPLPTGEKPVMPVFTPDGRYVYVSDEISGTVSGYSVDRDGRLSPTPGSPYTAPGAHGATISPDGRHLYVSDGGGVGGFEIGPQGELAPLPGSPYPAMAARVVLSPDGHRLFAVDGLTSVRTLIRKSDGTLEPSGLPPAETGVFFSDGQIAAITPNQGPFARLRVAEQDGSTVTFSADDSTDTDGNITHYHWDFGDGQHLTTTTPHTTHHYDDNNPHTTTLTVTDDENCSTQLIYTGTTATCTGSTNARDSITIDHP